MKSTPVPSMAEVTDLRTPPRGALILLEPMEGAPTSLEALKEVLDGLHPDAMLSGRLREQDEDWPSRPDVIRSELYMPQVPEDHPDYYPYRDGDNLAESTLHADGLIDLRVTLRTALARLPRTYVGMDQLLNYDKKNRTLVLAPDIYVLKDTDITPGDDVKSIKTWVQGVPEFVLELVSDSSLKNDLEHKLRVYAKIGVPEYVVWDPKGEHLPEKLRYYRLKNKVYQEVLAERTAQEESRITLEGLPVILTSDGYLMQVQDRETGELYLGADEERALRMSACEREAEAQRAAEAERALRMSACEREAEAQRAAEAERALRMSACEREAEAQRAAEEERNRADFAQRAAEEERNRADFAQRAAEEERNRAEQAQQREAEARQALDAQAAELLALRALLARVSPSGGD